MDRIPLITELNERTRKKDEFEIALERSGMSLPDEDEMEFDTDPDAEEVDSIDDEDYTSDTGLEDDEIQEIVDWCEEECSDLSDEELEDTLRDELEEVDIEPEQMDAAIDRVMSMLGRGSDEEDLDDDGEDLDDEEGFGDEEGMGDEDEFPPEEDEELPLDLGDLEFDPERDFRPEEDPDDFEIDPRHLRTDDEMREKPLVIDPKKHFRDYVRGEENEY